MLAVESSAGITPEVNLMNLLHEGEEALIRLWNQGQTSPEIQNKSISGSTERAAGLLKLKKNKKLYYSR